MWSKEIGRFLAHLQTAERSPLTLRNYRDDLTRFEAWFKAENNEDLLAERITGEDLRAFKAHLYRGGQGAKPATVNAKLSALRSFLYWATRSKMIEDMPQCPRDVAQMPDEPRWLDKREYRQLMRAIEHRRRKRDRGIVLVLLNTGLRVAELIGLDWRDVKISPRKGALTIRAGKGNKWRTVSLGPSARYAFSLLGHGTGLAGPVIMSREGSMSVRRLQRIVADCGKLAGLDLSPHMLRHTFAKRLLEKGAHITEVARILGHRNIQTTMRYLTPSGEDLQAVVDRLDEDD